MQWKRGTHHLIPRAPYSLPSALPSLPSVCNWASTLSTSPSNATTRDYQAHITPFERFIDDQICVLRREDLVNRLECHTERSDRPIHADTLSSRQRVSDEHSLILSLKHLQFICCGIPEHAQV